MKTFTKQPIIPEGWKPKPTIDNYNYLQWLADLQAWQNFIYKKTPYAHDRKTN